MKYIIPQDKVDKVVFKYLDLNLKGLEKREPKYYEGTIFTHNDETHGILGYKNNGTLYIYHDMVEIVSTTFGLLLTDTESIIGRWVSDRFQLKVKNTSETFGDTLRCKS